jgi:hypothetical protein
VSEWMMQDEARAERMRAERRGSALLVWDEVNPEPWSPRNVEIRLYPAGSRTFLGGGVTKDTPIECSERGWIQDLRG